MKEYKIDKKHFMSGWFIDKKVCDEIRESYLKMPNMFKTAGSFNFGQIDSKIKQSLDFFISPNHLTSPLYEYRKELQKCLDDVKDGGTFFKYQNLKIPAKKGLTLIWPSEWTHTHKGEVSSTKEKIIITGWYNFIE